MKNLLRIAVPVLVIVFCLYVYKQQETKRGKEANAQTLLEQAKQDTARYDTIFLGYRLGMTHKEYIDYNVKLMLKNKIRNKGQTNLNIYDTQLGEYEAEVEFGGAFYEDKLYLLPASYKIKGNMQHGPLTQALLRSYLTQKYGVDYIEEESGKTMSDGTKIMNYTWIDGNRKIYLYVGDGDNAMVVYEDWKLHEAKKNAEAEAKKSKSKQLKEDL